MERQMQVVILAGGLGTRIQSVAPDMPKALIPVAGKPFIEHQFALLAKYGLRDVVLCIGHMSGQIAEHVGDGAKWGMRVAYSYDPPTGLLGTGGAVVNALPDLAETFLVMYGDSYLPTDYAAIVAAFEACGEDAMMCVYRNENKWDKSNIRIADGHVVFYSKEVDPAEVDYIDYGITGYKKSLIEQYSEITLPLDLQKILQDQVAAGRLAACEVHDRFYEIGKPEGLVELDALFKQRAKA
ncbi:MAG: nucleotidyl transferase [Spartobacteria bacterium]|nr:nucleotidyl transferase [Spartobacteria bacterium]